jgi:hypothetical protein
MKRREYPLFERMTAPHYMSPAQQRIYKFCCQVRSSEPVDKALLDELATCFERIIFDGEKPGTALGLAVRGAPTKRDPQRFWHRVEIAAAVIQLKRKKPKLTIKRIADELVEVYGEKASFIEDCYDELKDEGAIALLPRNEAIKKFLKRGHTLINITPPKSPSK